MKKILLTSAAFLALTSPAAAEDVEFKISGFLKWFATYANQNDNVYDATTGTPNAFNPPAARLVGYDKTSLQTNGEIDFSGTYHINENTTLSFVMQLDMYRDKVDVDLSYLKLDCIAGRFIVGNSKNVSAMMGVHVPDVSTFALEDTDFVKMVRVPFGFAMNHAAYDILDDDTAKASYISPEIGDFSFGVSVMPSGSGMTPRNAYYSETTRFERGANAAVLYNHDFGKVELSVSADYAYTKPTFKGTPYAAIPVKEKDVHQYGGGIKARFGGFEIGVAAHAVNTSDEVGRHFRLTGVYATKGVTWALGASYKIGPFKTSASVLQSRADSLTTAGKKDVYTLSVASVVYTVMKGVDVFADAGYIDFKAAAADRDLSNSSPVFLTGAAVRF